MVAGVLILDELIWQGQAYSQRDTAFRLYNPPRLVVPHLLSSFFYPTSFLPQPLEDTEMPLPQHGAIPDHHFNGSEEEGEIIDDLITYERKPILPETDKKAEKEKDKLVAVTRFNRDWYGQKYLAEFILEDGTTIPGPNPRMSPCFRIEGVPVDPKVSLFSLGRLPQTMITQCTLHK